MVESLVVSRKFAIVALVAVDANAVEAAGGEQQLRAELERQVFALNVKLPSYSQISICGLCTFIAREKCCINCATTQITTVTV